MPRYEEEYSNTKMLWIVLSILGGLFLTMLLVCGGVIYWIAQNAGNFRNTPMFNTAQAIPELELQTEDYAEARNQFKTTLLKKGASPQASRPVKMPADAKEITFPSGKLELKAWINEPSEAKDKKAAVIFLHNGMAFGEEDWEMAKPFRDAGFVTMTPLLRGENGQAGTYTLFYDEVDDVLAAADYLLKQPFVDEKRLFVAGHTEGGTLALLTAMTSKRFRAAASFSGCPNLGIYLQGRQPLAPFAANNLRELQMRSPVAYATSFKCPVRLYFAPGEFMLDVASIQTATLAKQQGLDVEAVQVPGNNMTAVRPAMKQAIEFFQRP